MAHVEPLIRQAAAGGAQLILTPEGTNFLIQDREKRRAALATDDQDVVVVALTALEFLVAFLQAFVFAVLASIYLNDVVNLGHGH